MSSLDEAYPDTTFMEDVSPRETHIDDLASQVITEDNQYEFTFWALSLKPPSIDEESFNMLLSLSIPQWIETKTQTWIVAYTTIIDAAREQSAAVERFSVMKSNPANEHENVKMSQPKEKNIRPTDPVERRTLFASVYEKRLNRKYKKKTGKETSSHSSYD